LAIALEDRIRRALVLASKHGAVWVSTGVRNALADAHDATPVPVVDPENARAAVTIGSSVDARRAAVGEAVAALSVPLYFVLEDEGTLALAIASPNVAGVSEVLCRRGRIDLGAHGFTILEVEDGISARETQAEYAVPMLADERLTAFE
jgi:hypothetical protein